MPPPLERLAIVGSYVPRRCGIATYTHDLRSALSADQPQAKCLVAAINDRGHRHDYPDEVRFACDDGSPAAFRRMADFLNVSHVDAISLQHEYGLFGGEAGSHVLELLEQVRAPVHTTLHTVLARPSDAQRQVLSSISRLSARLTVMTERGRVLLRQVYGVEEERIDVIPHGIPDADLVDTRPHKARLGLTGTKLLLTFGLLSPNKGIEHVIRGMPSIVSRHPRALYLVVGATHPHLLADGGDGYREGLVRLARDLGVAEHVVFHDRYVDLPELLGFLGAADVYVTPYLSEDQITSGTLAYAFGCGKAVVSTPYWHARELLGDGDGVLVPFRDDEAIAAAVGGLLADDVGRRAMQERALARGRGMTWRSVARLFGESFDRARQSTRANRRPPSAATPRRRLPKIAVEHLWRLTDSTGVLQHASHDLPRLSEGYCTDDNARALELMVRLARAGFETRETRRAAGTYAAFLDHAFDPATARFRNFLSYDRRWLDRAGSDDCLGRATLALGAVIGGSPWPTIRRWAHGLFHRALEGVVATTSPRAWALGIVATVEAMRSLVRDPPALDACRSLTRRLVTLHRDTATSDWPWFEQVVAYENPRLCQALILAGERTGDRETLEVGLGSLDWLFRIQRSPHGRFSPVGCRGFYRRGGPSALFDQQPIEAHTMLVACLDAFRTTGDARWRRRAWMAFDWFRGRNILGLPLADPATGGCRDGLMVDRTNENRGAESTLAYVASVAELTLFESASGGSPRPEGPARARDTRDGIPCR